MKKRSVVILMAVLYLAATSFVVLSQKKPKLAGTSWEAKSSTQMLDGPKVTMKKVLFFKDKKNIEVINETHHSSYSAMRMNPDGTVDRIPAHSSTYSKVGTYKVKKNKVIITVDGETTTLCLEGNYLYEGESLDMLKSLPESVSAFRIFKKIEKP